MCKKLIVLLTLLCYKSCSFSMYSSDSDSQSHETERLCAEYDNVSEQGDSNDIIKKTQIILHDRINFEINDYIGQLPRTVHNIIKYLNNLERYPTNRTRSLLLYGPPGTGKTNIVMGIAKATKRTLFMCSASDILTKWAGSGANSIRSIFDEARKQINKIILFIDEIDSGTCDRAQDNNKHYSQSLISLTNQLDSLIENQEVPIFVIVTTNTESDLDAALISRLTSAKINLPSNDDRKQMLKLWIAAKNLTISEELLNKIIELTDTFSGRDIIKILDDAEFGAKDNSNVILEAHFIEKIKEIRAIKEEKLIKLNIDKEIKQLQLESLRAQKARLEQEDRLRQLQEQSLLEERAARRRQESRMEEEHKFRQLQMLDFLDTRLGTKRAVEFIMLMQNDDKAPQKTIQSKIEDQPKAESAGSCVIS